MNAYNPLQSMRRLEGAGLPREHAEAIASEIGEGTRDIVTKEYLKEYLDERLELTESRLFVRLGGVVVGAVTLVGALLGLLIALQ